MALPGGTLTYGYDPLTGKLVSAAGPYGIDLSYGRDGSLLTSVSWSGATSGSVSFGYDSFLRLSSETVAGSTVYHYDPLGSLLSVTLPDTTTISYLVDAEGRRIQKLVEGVVDRQFLYRGQLEIVAELDGSGNLVSRFVWADGTGGEERAVAAALERLGLPAAGAGGAAPVGASPLRSAPAYMVRGSDVCRLITDQLGSVRLVVDAATGTVAQRLDYDAWGQVLLDTNPGFQPFGFAGGLYDPDTGLVRFGARDYDPEAGRWTAADPIIGGIALNVFVLKPLCYWACLPPPEPDEDGICGER